MPSRLRARCFQSCERSHALPRRRQPFGVLTSSRRACAPALGTAELRQPEVSARSPFPPLPLPHPRAQPRPGGVGWKPAVPRRGAATAREQREPPAEVSCKTSSALVGQRCCLGVPRPSLPASPSGRTPRNTDRLVRFARHAVGKCSDQGSAEWGDTKPKGKRRATADHAAETPAASLQRAAPCGTPAPGRSVSQGSCRMSNVPVPSATRQRGKDKRLIENVTEGDTKEQISQGGAAER